MAWVVVIATQIALRHLSCSVPVSMGDDAIPLLVLYPIFSSTLRTLSAML